MPERQEVIKEKKKERAPITQSDSKNTKRAAGPSRGKGAGEGVQVFAPALGGTFIKTMHFVSDLGRKK